MPLQISEIWRGLEKLFELITSLIIEEVWNKSPMEMFTLSGPQNKLLCKSRAIFVISFFLVSIYFLCLLFCIIKAVFSQCSPPSVWTWYLSVPQWTGGGTGVLSNPRIPHIESCKFGALWSESSSYHMQSENNNLLCMHCTKLMVMLFHCYSHKLKFENGYISKLPLKWYLSLIVLSISEYQGMFSGFCWWSKLN